jgi:prepilin-type processing-associated H-X9-DG protein
VNFGFHSRHTEGANFVMADGSVKFMNDKIDLTIYRGIGTISGREVVTLP